MITFNPAPDRAVVERHSPLVASFLALIARAARPEGLALTRTGRFGRAVIAEAAARFPFPGFGAHDLAARSPAPSERDVPPLAVLRALMLELGLARATGRRLIATEAGAALGADPSRAFTTLVPALLFGAAHAHETGTALPGDWRLFLAVVNAEAAEGMSAYAFAASLYGTDDTEPALRLFESVLRPLGWTGLLTPPPRTAMLAHAFRLTPLWHDAVQLSRDAGADNVVPMRTP